MRAYAEERQALLDEVRQNTRHFAKWLAREARDWQRISVLLAELKPAAGKRAR
jgi:hypothetical protein